MLINIPGILTDRTRQRRPEWDSDDKLAERLSPESIAQVIYITPNMLDAIIYYFLKAYLYLVNQDQSAWTWELDRTSHSFLSI